MIVFGDYVCYMYTNGTETNVNGINLGDPEGGYDYTRGGNPTRTCLQTCLAKLENAEHAFVFASGMSATSTVVQAVMRSGNRILALNDLYGGTNRYVKL